MIKHRDTVCLNKVQERFMTGNGTMINRRAKVNRLWWVEQYMKAHLKMGSNMDMVSIIGQILLFIKVIGN